MNSVEAYQIAYNTHYKSKDYKQAYALYLQIIKDYPDTNECKYASQQIKNLSKLIDINSIQLEHQLVQTKNELQEKEDKESKERAEKQARIEAKNREDSERRAAYNSLIDNMILTTCPSIEGYRVTKQCGLVFGECLFKSGLLKSISASISNFADLLSFSETELSGSMELLERAREYAIGKLKKAAAERGANAVVGIDSESSAGGDIMHISISGTAVVIEEQTNKL